MRTRFVCVALLLMYSTVSQACDACGCSAGGVGFGYIPFQQRHMIGLHFQNNRFETLHPALFTDETDETSVDNFNALTLWGRYYISKRWFLSGMLPIKQHSLKMSNETIELKGFGDAQLQVYYALVSKGGTMSDKQTNWFIGSHISIPTGKIDSDNQSSLPNLQLGTGAWGAGLNSTFSWRRLNFGFSSEINTRLNAANNIDYRFGQEVSSNNLFFYRIKREKLTLIPQVGLYQMHRAKDQISASRKEANTLSGVQLFNAVIGSSVYFSDFGIRAYYHFPIHHSISNGYTKPTQFFNIQFLHLLKSNKK
ncbi:MAG: hypothetical protein ACI8SE_000271 [Bacteroidia bacterium]|jgi:hypothetical protein